MKICCPECQTTFPIAAGFFDADGKRLGMALAGAEPALGRGIVQYLALHKPAKTVLRLAKAAKLAEEVIELAAAPDVCRGGVCRPNRGAYWVQAIEQMLDQRAKLRLPLSGHGYLTEVAYGIADSADAAAERQREAGAKAGKHLTTGGADKPAPQSGESPLAAQLGWINQMVALKQFTPEQAEAERVKAREKYGNG